MSDLKNIFITQDEEFVKEYLVDNEEKLNRLAQQCFKDGMFALKLMKHCWSIVAQIAVKRNKMKSEGSK